MVSGKVQDEFGDDVPGVSILLEGTSLGTVSDISGAFLSFKEVADLEEFA